MTFINSSDKKKLLGNFASLFTLQMANYIFPLITFPYLVRVLGPEKFGLINFGAAFAAYFVVLTDYGFNLSATREISLNRNDNDSLSKIFTSVLIIKTCIAILSFIIFSVLIFTVPIFKKEALLYITCFGSVLGSVLFPVWFFQGMERMKYITILNISSRAITTICIFLFVTETSDYLILAILNNASLVMVGLLSQGIIRKQFAIKLKYPGFKEIRCQLREGWHLFVSTIAINLYTTSTVFILGIFTNNTIVGYYSAADKIRIAFQGIISTISQTIYPHISELLKSSFVEGCQFIKKLFIIMFSIGLLLSLFLSIFSKELLFLIVGPEYIASIMVLRILAWTIFLVCISNVLGIQAMLNMGMKSVFSKIVIGSSLLNLILAFILVPMYSELGSSISVVFTEIIVSSSMVLYFWKNKVDILKLQYV